VQEAPCLPAVTKASKQFDGNALVCEGRRFLSHYKLS
jgi:hypothetical protein